MGRLLENTGIALIENAKEVYFAYWRLEILKNRKISCNGEKSTIEQLIQDKKPWETETRELTITLGNQELKLKFNEDKSFTFEAVNQQPIQEKQIKGLDEYTDNDIAQHLLGSSFKVDEDQQQNLCISTTMKGPDNVEHQVGGPNKMSLYKLHISNLGRIIKHLGSKKQDDNMLVSLTTGSGKTFTQGLWMMVLQMAGVNGVFAIPDKLLGQYKSDLKRLLPDTLVEKLGEENSTIIIDSSQNILLGTSAERVQNLNSQKTLLSFDEAHLLAQEEPLFFAAKKLADKFVNLYLTATPTPSLYDLAKGEKNKKMLTVVATMNNEQ